MLKNLFHGLARAFTVPRDVRQQIDQNPLTATVKSVLLADLSVSIAGAVDKHIPDPALNAAAKREIGALLEQTGLLK